MQASMLLGDDPSNADGKDVVGKLIGCIHCSQQIQRPYTTRYRLYFWLHKNHVSL